MPAATRRLGCFAPPTVWRRRKLYPRRRLCPPAASGPGPGPWTTLPWQTLPVGAKSPYYPLSPRRATWLVLRREAQRSAAEAEQLAALRAQQAEIAEAINLAQDFARLVRQRQPEQLDPYSPGLFDLVHAVWSCSRPQSLESQGTGMGDILSAATR